MAQRVADVDAGPGPVGDGVKDDGWRKAILEWVEEEGSISRDSLHENAVDEADLEKAMAAADALVAEGVLEEKHEELRPAGSAARDRRQPARPD